MGVQEEIRDELVRLNVPITSLGGFQLDPSQEAEASGSTMKESPGRSIPRICCHCSRNCQMELGQQWSLKLCVSRVTVVRH